MLLEYKDTEQLRILKDGLFDIVSLRLIQESRDEPTILGLDLVGMNQGSGGEARAKYYTLLHDLIRHASAPTGASSSKSLDDQKLICKVL